MNKGMDCRESALSFIVTSAQILSWLQAPMKSPEQAANVFSQIFFL